RVVAIRSEKREPLNFPALMRNHAASRCVIELSSFRALPCRAVGNSKFFGHIGYEHALAAKHDRHIVSLVPALLLWGCPATVRRLVVAVYVYAFDGMFGGALAHVLEELLERFHPGQTHGYSTRAIVLEVLIGAIHAPASHSQPR